ncbi:recQ-mediated genome instability protein 1-like isoform X2 [Ischnura elegans]|nr:recQ-mediated genome instability protein 1-like isoform X2 [Ischnura elegans]
MGIGSLPPNLTLQKEVTLRGTYAVQVESVIDIGTPAYSQLLIERKVATENCEVTEKKAENWEPKPRRVLKLSIYDGVQELVAMEYSPVRDLNKYLIPGIKILIIGPVRCRRGIIMLEQKNVNVLGGEVDTLLAVNNVENILLRALNLSENNDPSPRVPSISTAGNADATVRRVSPPPLYQRNEGRVGQTSSNAPSVSDFPNDDEMVEFMAVEAYSRQEGHPSHQEAVDALPDDDDDDDLLLQLSVDELAMQAMTNNEQQFPSVSRTVPAEPAEPPGQVVIKWPMNSSHQLVSSEPFVYIAQLIESRPRNGIFAVKGLLFTLLSTLKEKDGRWDIQARLSDGSDYVDVSFSEEVLDELIGFSATEMKVLRQKMAGNPAIKEKLKKGFQGAKKKFHDMNCIFYLQFMEDCDLPVVFKIEEISSQHLTSMRSRILR